VRVTAGLEQSVVGYAAGVRCQAGVALPIRRYPWRASERRDTTLADFDERELEAFLDFVENDLRAQGIRDALRREIVGDWCTLGRDPEGDIQQTCKLCGATDWFTPPPYGLTPAKCCPECGLAEDPGDAHAWFDVIEPARVFWTAYSGEKPDRTVVVRCSMCSVRTEYSFRKGPSLACPACGPRP
jgi:hypothetical protein